MPLTPNQQLFQYTVVRSLGQSPVGHVYLAADTESGQPVAIREIVVTPQTSEAGFKRFVQTASAAGEVRHPNLVTTHTLQIVKARVYLVMEYLNGGSLRQLFEEGGSLPVETAVRIAGEVGAGLAAAHASKVAHADIKPENVMFGSDGRARLGGFGLIYAWQALVGAKLPGPPLPPGALLYQAPEQLRGQPASPRSDVYQLGLLLYEMLRGKHFADLADLNRRAREIAGSSDPAAIQTHLCGLLAETILNSGPPDVRRVRPGVPDWLADLVMAALARSADRRPNLDQLLEALQGPAHTLAGQPANQALIEQHFNRGLVNWQQHRFDRAATEFQVALRLDPRHAQAHYYLGLVAWQQGRLDQTIAEFEAALDINPTYVEACRNLGLAYWQQGRLSEAGETFQACLSLNPGDAEVQGYLETVTGQQQQVEQALAAHQIELRLNPRNSAAHYRLGLVYWQHGQLNQAINAFQAALDLQPDLIDAQLSQGIVYQQQGQLDQAINAFQAALQLNPDRAETHNNLGVIYRQQGQLDQAVAAYQAALRLNPVFLEARSNLGLAYWQQGQLDQAVAEFKIILAAQPGDIDARNHLGLIYTQQGRLAEAAAEFRAALRQEPNNAEAHHHLGSVYMLESRWAEAGQEFQLALTINPGYTEAEYNLRLVSDRQNTMSNEQ